MPDTKDMKVNKQDRQGPLPSWGCSHLTSLTEIKGLEQKALSSPSQLFYSPLCFSAKRGLKHSGMFCFPEQMLFLFHVHIAQAADV